MKTIAVNIEESLLAEVERVAHGLAMTREDFMRAALTRAVQQQEIIRLEQKHARGYAMKPQTDAEIGEWEAER